MTPSMRKPYDDVVACVPVTIPYRRYSTNTAHWWIGRALRELVRRAGVRAQDIDGLSVSSSRSRPTRLSASPSISACRRGGLITGRLAAHRAWSRCGVPPARWRPGTPIWWRAWPATATTSIPSARPWRTFTLRAGCSLSLWRRRPKCQLRADRAQLHEPVRRAAGGSRQVMRRAARECAELPLRADEDAADAGGVHGRAADRRSDPPLRLRDAVRPRSGPSRRCCAGRPNGMASGRSSSAAASNGRSRRRAASPPAMPAPCSPPA